MGNDQSTVSNGRLAAPGSSSQRPRSMSRTSRSRSPNPPVSSSRSGGNASAAPPPPYTLVDTSSPSSPVSPPRMPVPSVNLGVPGGSSPSSRSDAPLPGLPVNHPFLTPTTPTFAPPPGPPPGQAPISPIRGGRDVNLRRRNTTEDLLDMLKKYNTVIIVDDSSSMAGRRWRETRQALAGLAGIAAEYDVDGVDVHFLNSPVVGENMHTAQAVEALFDSIDPDGITPTGEKLEILLLDYLLQIEEAQDKDKNAAKTGGVGGFLKAIRPINYIILTDGAPTDDPESVIITAARRLDANKFPLSQVGIQFVQIGDDAQATESLKELDDALSGEHGVRDMVDTTVYSPTRGELSPRDIAKILLGGINRRIDKKGAPAS